MRLKYCLCLLSNLVLITAELKNDNTFKPLVRVNKCCEPYELFVNNRCTHMNETDEKVWSPIFTDEKGRSNVQVDYTPVIGWPDCGSSQQWPIYHNQTSTDELRLLPNGVLRHYLYRTFPGEEETGVQMINEKETMYHDYVPGKYCMEKRIEGKIISEYALVCKPEYVNHWTNTEFLMRNIASPITHAVCMICYLIVAIIYFIMPTLRDLVGNMVTTISVCFIVNQAADMTRLLTIFSNHVSIFVAETVCYISLLGAFFWLNSLGYYIWKTFKSRNVFLRVTDGKKYCYYSAYAWSCTLVMGILAVFAHFALDYSLEPEKLKLDGEQETIGSLGIIIFFVPVAVTVLVNVLFFASTLKILNRMNTYGRIHHKLKHSFRMFLLLFLVMTVTWLFFLMSFTKYDGLVYCYIVFNALQAPLFLYICVCNQKHVSFLIRKSCCYADCICPCCRPDPECEWGDEMTAMNTGFY